MEAWSWWLPALSLCALLVLTHTYFGLHVLARGIVFVDLALAQVAALGAALAFLLGEDLHNATAQGYALGAALVAAAGFAGLRRLPDKTLREAAIGCVYVVATALTILILSRSAPGMEEWRRLLSGNILWVRWQEVGGTALVFGAIAALHLLFHRRFELLSFQPNAGSRRALLWELVFFGSFAVVITLAVRLAGILLVFAFLILPAFSAALLTQAAGARLVLGWLLGLAGAGMGLAVSLFADLPTGPTMVAVLGLLPVLAAALRKRRGKPPAAGIVRPS